jgi:hypothetical protein
MADVMTVDTRVHPTTTHVAIRVEFHHLLRAAEAADLLSCLSDVAALIAGSDYVELAEADPADAERWKSLALIVRETVLGDYWDLVVDLPGCTPEQVQEFVAALRKIHDVADDPQSQPGTRELTEAGELLVKESSDVPRTAPVDELHAIVERLSSLTLKIVAVEVRMG